MNWTLCGQSSSSTYSHKCDALGLAVTPGGLFKKYDKAAKSMKWTGQGREAKRANKRAVQELIEIVDRENAPERMLALHYLAEIYYNGPPGIDKSWTTAFGFYIKALTVTPAHKTILQKPGNWLAMAVLTACNMIEVGDNLLRLSEVSSYVCVLANKHTCMHICTPKTTPTPTTSIHAHNHANTHLHKHTHTHGTSTRTYLHTPTHFHTPTILHACTYTQTDIREHTGTPTRHRITTPAHPQIHTIALPDSASHTRTPVLRLPNVHAHTNYVLCLTFSILTGIRGQGTRPRRSATAEEFAKDLERNSVRDRALVFARGNGVVGREEDGGCRSLSGELWV